MRTRGVGGRSAPTLSHHGTDTDVVCAKVFRPRRAFSFRDVHPQLENLPEGVATPSTLSFFRVGSGASAGSHHHAPGHSQQAPASANDPAGCPAAVLFRAAA